MRCARAAVGIVLATTVLSLAGAAPAFAGAWWHVSSRAAPTYLTPGGQATIILTATNVGDGGVTAAAKPVTITDMLPPGLEATAIKGAPAFEQEEETHRMSCELATLTCSSAPEVLPAFQALYVEIQVNVKSGAVSGEQNLVSVRGGEQEGQPGSEVPDASVTRTITVNGQSTPFGVEENGYQLTPEEEGGELDTRAGSHPFQLTTTLDLDQTVEAAPEHGLVASAPALPKNLSFNLPPGLIGDPLATPRCPMVDFLAIGSAAINACPSQSAIGVVVVRLNEPSKLHNLTRVVPLFNLEPAHGEPARLGFEAITVPVVLDTSVRTGGDYGVTVSVRDAPEAAQILSSEVTIWGEPGDPRHDNARGWACVLGGAYYFSHEVPCEPPSPRPEQPFLTLPGSCTGASMSDVQGESWPQETLGGEPGQTFSLEGSSTETLLAALRGCEALPFSPTFTLQAEQHAASTPTGLKADLHLPQQHSLESGGLAESDLRETRVTLPEGMQLNPSAANGLQACTEAQVGYEGLAGTDPFAPGASQPLRFSSAPAQCPDASKVGSVRVRTPLLEHELSGAVYLAEPAPQGEMGKNPSNSLIALYVVAEDPYSGIRVKLAGEAKLDGQTGQVTTVFATSPQVPFEDFELEFFSGPRASLATPALCGAYQTEASFLPWSGTPAVNTRTEPGELQINSGAEGNGCASTLPFAPSLNAGAQSLQAGAFTSFELTLTRPEADQPLKSLSVTLPPGVAALLSSVTPCPEPQAGQGACGAESLIGEATAVSGLGPDPYTVGGGRVYITGPYDGAPFGLSIVTPAVAGPFDLGDVVVRSTISVNPHTAQVTIDSSLPAFVQGVGMPASGVPLELRQVHVTVDRPDFEFNPTSCDPMTIAGEATGTQGGNANLSSSMQVTGCEGLPFKPGVSASTLGRTSKADGASLGLTFRSKGGEARVAKTILTIPATLPARLTTIQKACVASVFEANPAACPEGSDIGTAVVHTPVLKGPLMGPIYLVSHGNAAWPDAELVLQGEGVIVILDGQTAIKKGVTTSSFLSVPDAPFESVQATLPEGPHSALTTNLPLKDHYSLCGQHLTIPTALTGQNATTINEAVNVSVQNCARTVKTNAGKKPTRAQRVVGALRVCRSLHRRSRSKRARCERRARRSAMRRR
ncbi:MAG TPA: hypothetical protein VMB51_08850 [Solirubrobacteraceae bacterium]|nr:hypothetical protein [Solirubrobacteraceae bacterium]